MSSLISHTQIGYTEFAKDSFLKNTDLMAMTFSHIQVDTQAGMRIYKKRYLLNAALTCKDFLDVALDALWEELYSLVPLLKLLPALQVEDGAYVRANVYVFLYDNLFFL
jgi:hypothetical protein